MIKVDLNSPVPIHEQIKGGFREHVLKGLLKAGDPVPSVRELAETLVVNPNTVTRAYQELIKEGFLVSQSRGNFISQTAQSQAATSLEEALQQLLETLQLSRRSGLDWEDIDSIVQIARSQDQPQETSREKETPAILKRLKYFEPTGANGGKAVCPYCKEDVAAGEATAFCVLCKTIHHRECWQETGHCSVFGCKGKVTLPF